MTRQWHLRYGFLKTGLMWKVWFIAKILQNNFYLLQRTPLFYLCTATYEFSIVGSSAAAYQLSLSSTGPLFSISPRAQTANLFLPKTFLLLEIGRTRTELDPANMEGAWAYRLKTAWQSEVFGNKFLVDYPHVQAVICYSLFVNHGRSQK